MSFEHFEQFKVFATVAFKQTTVKRIFTVNSRLESCECCRAETTEESTVYASVKTQQAAATSSECRFFKVIKQAAMEFAWILNSI